MRALNQLPGDSPSVKEYPGVPGFSQEVTTLMTRLTNLYPLWLILTALLAYVIPSSLGWFNGQWISAALMTVMLGMGFTLTINDFQRLWKVPFPVAVGFFAQYCMMPLTAWGIARILSLEPGFAAGLILLGSCPGGTASNVITYLARGDLALSVVMTMVSTLLAFVMTPFWVKTLAGQYIPVDPWALCLSTLQVVILPVIVGVLCNWKFPRAVGRISRFGPIVSVIAICLITGGVVSQSAEELARNAVALTVAVTMLHLVGFVVGYGISRSMGWPETTSRTVSIEVGMQNGGMAAMLAKKHFVSHPLAAVPAVFSAVMQNILGSLLASWWRSRPPVTPSTTSPPSDSVSDNAVAEWVSESTTT